MAIRAAICIGINNAGSMRSLQAAAKGARDFEDWARRQNCHTKLLTDDANVKVSLTDIFDAVKEFVEKATYEQLIIYFSGHGILSAPGTEFWLLSRAPENPNEAVNLLRSIEDARNSRIPHIVFVSDACRSSVAGPPLNGVVGGTIFPNEGYVASRSEVDVYYATRPGNPAWEVPVEEATKQYRGIFTESLLSVVRRPEERLVDEIAENGSRLHVVTSRKLKPYLEATVPVHASTYDIRIRQTPELRVETALPKYFAEVDTAMVRQTKKAFLGRAATPHTVETALEALRATHFQVVEAAPPVRDTKLASRLGLTADVARLAATRGRGRFETRTGFTVVGARPTGIYAKDWQAEPAFAEPENDQMWHVRLSPRHDREPASVVFEFDRGSGMTTGTVLAVLPDFIGTVVLDTGQVISVNYVPSEGTWRHDEYRRRAQQLESMKAFAAVAARNGYFKVENERASELADRIRQAKGLDPTMGLYAAYAYAQVGQYEDVDSVFRYMRDDPQVPIPFDVVMLATRYMGNRYNAHLARYAPFVPMLSQGWALHAPGDPMFQPVHLRLRSHLLPSLWLTLDRKGVAVARDHVEREDIP